MSSVSIGRAVERSERNISIDNIARIAKGLRTEPWTLLKEDPWGAHEMFTGFKTLVGCGK
jgi:hypothetical protein